MDDRTSKAHQPQSSETNDDPANGGPGVIIQRLINRYAEVNWALADQALVSAANFVTGILLARALGPANFGVYALAWFTVLFIYALQFAYISSPMLSIAAKFSDQERPRYFGGVFMQFGVTVIGSFVLVYGGTLAFGELFPDTGAHTIALALAFATIGYQIRDFLRRYFFACDRSGSAFLLDLLGYGGQVGLLAALMWTDEISVSTALWAITIVAFASTAMLILRIATIVYDLSSFREVFKRHWEIARWLIGSAILDSITNQLALLLSGAFLGSGMAGTVRASESLMGVAHIIFLASQNVIPKRAGQILKNEGKKSMRRFIFRMALAIIGVTVCIALFFGIYPEFWLTLLFGDKYAGSGNLLRWFGVVFIVRAISYSIASGLWSLEKTSPIFIGYVFASIVGLGSAYPLMQAFGVTGAIFSALLAELVLAVILCARFIALTRP